MLKMQWYGQSEARASAHALTLLCFLVQMQPAVPDMAGFFISLSTHTAAVMLPQGWVHRGGGCRGSALSHGAG